MSLYGPLICPLPAPSLAFTLSYVSYTGILKLLLLASGMTKQPRGKREAHSYLMQLPLLRHEGLISPPS
jgi:hypothetical protein